MTSFCKHVSIKPAKPVHLAAPKNTPIKKSDLAKYDGKYYTSKNILTGIFYLINGY